MAYKEREQGNIINVTKKQYNELNQGLSVKGYKKSNNDILVPSFNDIYSKGEMDSKITQIVYCTYNNGNLSISDEELKKIFGRHNDHLLLKMVNMNTRETEILKLVAYSEQESQQGFIDYIFSNGVSEINLTVDETGDEPVIDEFLLFAYVANIARYASGDRSKGTIEERLTKLGFKEGVASIDGATATINTLKKQGKYCIFNLLLEDYYLPVKETKTITLTIPVEFRPKEETKIPFTFFSEVPSMVVLPAYDNLTVGTDGIILISLTGGNKGNNITVPRILNAGWEIK